MDGCTVLQGNQFVNCRVTVQNCPHSHNSLLNAEQSARSDHSSTSITDADTTARDQQTSYGNPPSPTGTTCDKASSQLLPPLPTAAPDSGQDGNLIDGKEYYTYQTLCGMETLCRALAFSKHKVTLNRFGGIAFESVPSRIVTPIGNVKQMTMKLRTIRRRITGHCWHELHMEGWVVKLPDDAEAKRWMSHLKNIPGALLDTKEFQTYSINKECKVQPNSSYHSEAPEVPATSQSRRCRLSACRRMQKKKEQQMYCAFAHDVLLKYRLAEVISGSWRECSKCLEVSDHEVYDIQSWYTTCVERAYAVLDTFHEQCGKKSRNFEKEVENRLSCLPQFPELQRALNTTDHLCVRELCPGIRSLQEVHEVPTAAVCQMVSCDDAIAAKWTKLARLLGLSRSQIDRIRLEYHDRPQPCRQSATEVLSLWRTSGGTANTCSLATLLKVLLHMGQDLVVSKVVECLQSRTDT